MKIIFQESGTGHELIFNTDWTFGKKILEECWKELTTNTFNRKIEEQNRKLNR